MPTFAASKSYRKCQADTFPFSQEKPPKTWVQELRKPMVAKSRIQTSNWANPQWLFFPMVNSNPHTMRASVAITFTTMPPTHNLMELLLMIDAAKRASAHKIIAVIPYFGWARQDRKDQPRVSIGSKLVANLLTAAGVNRIITLDLHADQIQGFFDIPVDALYASSLFIDYIQKLQIEDLQIASPDVGGSKRASAYAKRLGCDLAICHKHRPRANVVDSMTLIGDVKDKNVILVDDIIDTAGTIVKAGQVLMDNGAKSVRAFATHAVCSGPAMERLDNSVFSEVVVTDSIPLPANASKKIHVVSTAELFADVIHRIESYESISSLFK